MNDTVYIQIYEYSQITLSFSPSDCKWIPFTNKSIIIGQSHTTSGIFQIQQIKDQKLQQIHLQTLEHGLKCSQWIQTTDSDYAQIALGDIKGNLIIYDLEKLKKTFQIQAHEQIINSIDCLGGMIGHGAPEIITGSRDGKVKLWDPRQNIPVLELQPDWETKGPTPDCWSVCLGNSFTPQERVFVAGYDNGDIKVFDLRLNQIIFEQNLKNGICGLEFDRQDTHMNKLVATCLEGQFHVFDLKTRHPVNGFSFLTQNTTNSTVWGIKHNPFNRDLFGILNGDGHLGVYQYQYPEQRVGKDKEGRLQGVVGNTKQLVQQKIADQPIVGMDWNKEKQGLALAISLDQKARALIITGLNKI